MSRISETELTRLTGITLLAKRDRRHMGEFYDALSPQTVDDLLREIDRLKAELINEQCKRAAETANPGWTALSAIPL